MDLAPQRKTKEAFGLDFVSNVMQNSCQVLLLIEMVDEKDDRQVHKWEVVTKEWNRAE